MKNKKTDNWFQSLFKGLNIWTFILLGMFFWSTFIVPALAKGFATQEDLKKVKEITIIGIQELKAETEIKLKDVKGDIKDNLQKLEDKIDKYSINNQDKIDKIYKLLIDMKK